MRLPYVIVTLAMLASVSTAQAIPNMWTSGFGMGVTEYIISSPEKVIFNLNCTGNPDEQNILQHGVLGKVRISHQTQKNAYVSD